jgi:ATP-dependent Clp protease ATP-binding subunit ClpA
VGGVVNKFIFRLESQLADRNVAIQLDDSARKWLVARGYDKANGARPMARLIAEKIKKPLADEVLFGRLTKGGTVKVTVENDELTFQFSKATASGKQAETGEELVN